MKRLITLVFQLYRPILIWNLICSVLGLWFIAQYGVSAIGNSLNFKVIGYFSSLGYQYFMTNKAFFYFRNAGYSIRRLYTYAFIADTLAYLISIIFYCLALYGYEHIKG